MLVFEDAKGANQTLYYGAGLEEGIDIRQFTMPPRSPRSAFDIRYATGRRLIEKESGLIRIQATALPVTVTAARMPAAFGEALVVEELGREGTIRTHALAGGQSLAIDNPAVIGLRIHTAEEPQEERPERFTLLGNFPNPFNPTTTVVFDLPEDGQIRISVYDMLGKRVMTLPARAMAAGRQRQIVLDASALASGMYLYRIEAATPSGTHVGTGKLILLK